MSLTNSQTAALEKIDAFLKNSKLTTFSLQGGAGVGKTFLVSEVVKRLLADGRRLTVAAPTHKACRVLRGKLDAAGISWVFKPKSLDDVPPDAAIVDTTAALLGIRPVITDDQTEDEITFKPTDRGTLAKAINGRMPVLIIDEVSMVSREDFVMLTEVMRAAGAKLIAVGDEGQLPPVKKQAIDFSADFDTGALLDEVVRQAKGSAIIELAWAIRRGDESWEEISGSGIENVPSVVDAFLEQVTTPVDDETKRTVFIAYRNAVVNGVQEKACRKLYGHSARNFAEGELVLATMAGYREVYGTYRDRQGRVRPSKFPKMEQVVAVADQLRVLSFDRSQEDEVYGVPVTLDRVDLPVDADGKVFTTNYLSAEQLADPNHPFNTKKRELAAEAKRLQDLVKKCRAEKKAQQAFEADEQRKRAWVEFFKHEEKIISFAHPFAITSHKSQGSTYHSVFVDAGDLVRFNRKALYVAVTRPSQRLVL
jgi:exodeoxyribonuclease-5